MIIVVLEELCIKSSSSSSSNSFSSNKVSAVTVKVAIADAVG